MRFESKSIRLFELSCTPLLYAGYLHTVASDIFGLSPLQLTHTFGPSDWSGAANILYLEVNKFYSVA